MIADFLSETMGGLNRGTISLKWWKKSQSKILYPGKISFKNKGEIKTRSEKQNVNEHTACPPAHHKKCKITETLSGGNTHPQENKAKQRKW